MLGLQLELSYSHAKAAPAAGLVYKLVHNVVFSELGIVKIITRE